MTSLLPAETRKTGAEEARAILSVLIADLSSGVTDPKGCLRKSLHVANLVNWPLDVGWFTRELYGYPSDLEVPWYRRQIPVTRKWRADGLYDQMEVSIASVFDATAEEAIEHLDVQRAVDDLTKYAETGVYQRTGNRESRRSSRGGQPVEGGEVLSFSKESVSRVLRQLEEELFRWASSAYVSLRFGDDISGIWDSHRSRVEAALTQMGLSNHLNAISEGLASAELQKWRQAMWSCRDLLHDVAAFLWRDERPSYPHLQDNDGKDIQVTDNKYINRLMAYLHQKGVVGTTGEYLRAEWVRLGKLHALASKAHDAGAVTLEDARLTAISVYIVLGEFVNRTDMEPIDNYE